MKKNKTVKIMAIMALLAIIVSVIGTGVLILTSSDNKETSKEVYRIGSGQTITKEELEKLLPNTNINLEK